MPVHGGRSAGNARAGALERGGPCPRGCLALERGGPHPRVGVEPRARRTLPEGALRPRARRTSPEGASNPRARRTSLEGRLAAPSWRAAGATRGVVVSCMCFRCVTRFVICVFAGFKRVSPGYLGDPYGYPRHHLCWKCKFILTVFHDISMQLGTIWSSSLYICF
jgi:hypothetical protein